MFKETYRRLNDIIQPDKALVAAVLAGGQRRKRGAKQPFVRLKPALIAAAICLCLVLTVPVLAASVEPVYELIYLVSPSAAQFFVPVQKSDGGSFRRGRGGFRKGYRFAWPGSGAGDGAGR